MTSAENQALLSELARVRCIFQVRALAAVIGVPAPTILASSSSPRKVAQ